MCRFPPFQVFGQRRLAVVGSAFGLGKDDIESPEDSRGHHVGVGGLEVAWCRLLIFDFVAPGRNDVVACGKVCDRHSETTRMLDDRLPA